LVCNAGGLVALGADDLHLAGVDRGLSLHDTAGLALATGLGVAGDDVDALHDDLAVGGHNDLDLALLALVLAGQDDNGIALLDFHICHLSVPLKLLPVRGTGSSCNPCRAARVPPAQRYGFLWGSYRP